ncbi:hypothetical protein KW800_00635 [Candidatus Parcubacteria bacterium]|nr:hypothetical protein [Candidatus Parcubacteria bacterium]
MLKQFVVILMAAVLASACSGASASSDDTPPVVVESVYPSDSTGNPSLPRPYTYSIRAGGALFVVEYLGDSVFRAKQQFPGTSIIAPDLVITNFRSDRETLDGIWHQVKGWAYPGSVDVIRAYVHFNRGASRASCNITVAGEDVSAGMIVICPH